MSTKGLYACVSGWRGIVQVMAVVCCLPIQAVAQSTGNESGAGDAVLDEVVTIGTRVEGRTATDTPVAVDVFNAETLGRNGHVETARLLQRLSPSFNFGTNNTSDGSDSARPATLRGLSPDQVLVLVNGKRHVGQAWLNIGGSLGRGTTGVDINSIPTAAIKQVEILRDGASSQYGSDAIAGVINFVLKDSAEEGSIRAQWGSTYDGDGDSYLVSANKGFALGPNGFINLTLELKDRDPTNRATVSNRSFAFPGATPTAGRRIFRLGDGEEETHVVMANAAIELSDSASLYGFGKLMNRDGQSTGFFRHPHQSDRSVPQIYPDGFLPLQNTEIEDTALALGLKGSIGSSDWGYDASVSYGQNRFEFGAENTVNASIAAEFLAANPAATDADIAASAGPTSGKSGEIELEQVVLNFDITGRLGSQSDRPFYIAAGIEYRDEDYRIGQGDPASFSCGSSSGPASFQSVNSQQGAAGAGPNDIANCGFQGFPGYGPDAVTGISRSNFGLYVDVEKDISDRWLLSAALRYEDYDDAGDRVTGKIASKIDVNDSVSLRGSFSTGFRAASLPQLGFTSIVTQAGAGGLSQTLIANGDDPFTQALGIDALDFETSNNYSIGIVVNPTDSLSITLDAYRIDIDDRVTLSSNLSVAALNGAGLMEAADSLSSRTLGQASTFFNALDTQTNGVDAVATWDSNAFGGSLNTTFSYSYTDTSIEDVFAPAGIGVDQFFSREAAKIIEDIQPNNRASLTFDWRRDNIGVLLRTNYFGETSSLFFTAETIFGCPTDQACGPVTPFNLDPTAETEVSNAMTVDLEVSLDISDNLKIAFGGNNILDAEPDEIADNSVIRWISDGGGFGGPPNASFGNFRFPTRGVPYGLNGGYYYLRAVFEF